MARKRAFRALEGIDADRLASFQAGIRKRYSVRDPRGAAAGAARPRRRARPHPHSARPRGAAPFAPLEVALLAHVRLADDRAARGRLRRARWRGAARAGRRAGREARAAAEASAEVRGLGGGPPARRELHDRVAGLPDVRFAPRRVVDLPVPDRRASARAGRPGQRGGPGGLGDGREGRKAREARGALVRSANRRQRALLDEGLVGPEALRPRDASVGEREQRALRDLSLLETQADVALDGLEREAGRGEEGLAGAAAEPARAPDAASEVEEPAAALVEPGGRHRAVQLLERVGAVLGRIGQREDRLRVDGHLRFGAPEAVPREDLLV